MIPAAVGCRSRLQGTAGCRVKSPGTGAPPCGSQLADTNVLVRSSFRVSGLLVVMKSIPPCDAGHHVLHRVDRPYVRDHAVGMCLLDPSRIARISRKAVVDTPDAVLPDCGGSQVAVQVLHHGTREGVDDAFAGRIVESDVFHTVGQPLCLDSLDDGIRRTGVVGGRTVPLDFEDQLGVRIFRGLLQVIVERRELFAVGRASDP